MNKSLPDEMVVLLPRLRRYAMRLASCSDTANDLVQMTMLKGLRFQHQFNSKHDYQTDLFRWLCSIMYSQHINEHRQRTRLEKKHAEYRSRLEGLDNTPAAVTEARVILRDIETTLADLPKEHRDLVIASALDGPDYNKLAEDFGIPIGTVRSRLSRGRTRAREFYGV